MPSDIPAPALDLAVYRLTCGDSWLDISQLLKAEGWGDFSVDYLRDAMAVRNPTYFEAYRDQK